MKNRIIVSLAVMLSGALLLWAVLDDTGDARAQSEPAVRSGIIAERAVDYPADI